MPDRATSRAILVGTSVYKNPGLLPIPAVANSLAGMREILTDPDLCGWPEDRVTVLQDPEDIRYFVPRLRQLVETTEDVLFLYFAGHGIILPNGQLCLALTDTNPEEADSTGLTYDKVRQLLQGSPARVKAVVLDSCYSGRAIRTMADLDSGITDIEGVYTLAASDGAADVAPLAEQAMTATSFTRELIELVRTGVPGGPKLLTFSVLYRHLQFQLRRSGLPRPRQGCSDTADRFPFTRNVAQYIGFQAIERYGLAMTAAFAPCRERGLTEEQLADTLYLSGEAVAGYLSGRRVAPVEVLRDFFHYLDRHGCGLAPDAQRRIVGLRDAADTAVAHDPRQVAALQRINREQEAEIRALHAAWDRERTEHARATSAAEQELTRLKQTVDEQGRQLSHAADYVHTLEAELAEIRREANEVSRELRVLRTQLTRLTDPPVETLPENPILVTAVTRPADTKVPALHGPPEFSAVGRSPMRQPLPPRVAEGRNGSGNGQSLRPAPSEPRKWNNGALLYSDTVRSVAGVLGLLCVVLGIVWGVLQHGDAVGDLSAKPCTTASSEQRDCLASATGQIVRKEDNSSEDGPSRTLTVDYHSAQDTYSVGYELYEAVKSGDTVDLKIWKGKVVRIGHAGLSQRVQPDFSWPRLLVPVLFSAGLLLVGVAVFKPKRSKKVAYAVLWIFGWSHSAAAELIGATAWWQWLLGLLLLLPSFIGLGILVS